jgi:DNA-binding transcriptional LysR family regulator
MITDFRMKVFQTVAARLSFTQAARELFISQPAVTRHIGEMEKAVGRPLFDRNGKAISLTSEGKQLLDFAERILGLYGELNEAVGRFHDTVAGDLRIGASTTAAQYVLPRILALFRQAYPQVGMTLLNDNSRAIENLAIAGKIDLGIIEGKAGNPLLHYQPFVEDEIVLAARTGNRLLKKDSIEAAMITTLPLAVREAGSGTREIVEKTLATKGIQPAGLRIEMALGSSESLKSYLLHSETFAFLSVHAILDEMVEHKLRIVEIKDLDIIRHFYFVTLHGAHSALLSRFRQFCLEHYNRKA